MAMGRRRALRVLASAPLLAPIAAACGREREPASSGPLAGIRITFSASLAEEEQRAVRALLARFERETGARVTLVAVAAETLPEKLKVDVRAGRPTIDLFAQDNLILRVLVDGGLAQPLDDVAIPEGVQPAMVPARFGGRRYFLPFRPNVQVTYVNKARFRQAGAAAPRTADELRMVARRLKAAAGGVPKVTLPLAQGAPAAVTVAEWIVAFGGDPLALDDAGSVAAVTFLQDLWREGLLAKESLVAKYDSQVDFLQGETAWLAPNWPFTSQVFAEEGLLDRFHVYAGWRGPARAAHVIGGDVLGVPAGVAGRARAAATALARFLMGREAQQFLVAQNAWPSIRGDPYGTVPEIQRETFDAVRAALAGGWTRPTVPYWAAVSEAMNEAVRRVLERGEPPRRVLDSLHGRIRDAARRSGSAAPS